MNKGYQKPDAEYVSLVALESVTSGGLNGLNGQSDFVDGEMGLESSIF